MAADIAQSLVLEQDELEIDSHTNLEDHAKPLNGKAEKNIPTVNPSAHNAQTNVPTFPLEVGWREVVDPETGEVEQQPLTLLDLLFPTEDDIGVVVMAQSLPHADWIRWLTSMLEAYLKTAQWIFLNDVFIHWDRVGVPPKAPDIAAIYGGKKPPKGEKSYHVGRDGPLPAFVVEVTSEETRDIDLEDKKIFYAALGIQELLIIDTMPEESDSWELLGYRLGQNPFYNAIQPDAEEGFTFETVGLRFVAVGYEQIEVYNAATGESLLKPESLKEFADAETERADTEAERADVAEQRAESEAQRADTEAERADVAEQRAESEAQRADVAEQRANAAEAELARLQALLAQSRGNET